MSGLARRLAALRRWLAAGKEPCLLVSNPASIRYLTGASDASWALVAQRRAILCPSALGFEAARQGVGHPWEVLRPAPHRLGSLLGRLGMKRVGFESEWLTHAATVRLRQSLRDRAILVPLPGLVEACRAVKGAAELATIRRAGEIAREAGAQVPWILREGMTEAAAAAALDVRMRELGAQGPAFETIMLFGARSALPHGVPGARRLRRGDFILADFGARVDGYASDVTRVWCWRRATARQSRVYRAVYRAYLAGRAAVRAGAPAGNADAAARKALGRLEPRFIHGLGHGVGLDIHEAPRLGRGERTALKAGMVVTVEPGVYFARWGGIRIEDSFIVNGGRAESVTGKPAPDLPVIGPV